jgi:hypothetical protein
MLKEWKSKKKASTPEKKAPKSEKMKVFSGLLRFTRNDDLFFSGWLRFTRNDVCGFATPPRHPEPR